MSQSRKENTLEERIAKQVADEIMATYKVKFKSFINIYLKFNQ